MAGRAGRRSAHEEAVARRLALLGAELAAARGASTPSDNSTHTRIRAPRESVAVSEPSVRAAVPTPGRHAARGRLTLGPFQLVVVAIVVLAGFGAAAWWLLGGGPAEVAAPPPRPAGDLVTISATPTSSGSA